MKLSLLFGQYYPGQSLIHKTHPVLKISLLILFSLNIFLLSSLLSLTLLFLLPLLALTRARIRLRFILQSLTPVLFLLSLTFLVHAFSTEGRILYQIAGLCLTLEGIERGVFYSLRILAVSLASILLIATTTTSEIAYAVEKMVHPLKHLGFPAIEFALMFTICLRFIPLILDELERIMLAQQSRGALFSSGPWKDRLRAWKSLLLPLLRSCLERADRLALALYVRGFDPEKPRTSLRTLPLSLFDLQSILAFSLWLGLSLYAPILCFKAMERNTW